MPFCLLVIVHGTDLAWLAFTSGERSRAVLGLPMRWIIKSTQPLGTLLLIAGTTVFARNGLFLLGGEPHPAPAGGEA